MSPRRLLGCLALMLCFGTFASRPEPSFAQTSPRPAQKAAPADPVALLKQVSELFKAGKYQEAIPVARRIIAELDRMGAGQLPIQAQNFTMLGELERLTGNSVEAEKQFQASLRSSPRIRPVRA